MDRKFKKRKYKEWDFSSYSCELILLLIIGFPYLFSLTIKSNRVYSVMNG